MLSNQYDTLNPMPDVASPSPPTSVDLRPPDGLPTTAASRRRSSAGPAKTTADDRPAVGSATAPAPPPPPPGKKRSQKFTRSRDGCLACRKIKQRCDATKPICVRCVISNKECTWPLSVSQNASAMAKHGPLQPPLPAVAAAPVAPDTAPPTIDLAADDRHRPFSDVSGPSSRAGATSVASSASSVSPPAHAPMPLPAGAEVRRQQALDNLLQQETPTDQLQLCFPSPEERSLMSHFLGNGATLSQSIPSHLPMLFLHPAQLVASPRGLSIPSDALLFSLLSMASNHQSSMLNVQRRRGQVDNLVSLVNGRYTDLASGDSPTHQDFSQRSLSLAVPTSSSAQEAQDRSRLLAAHLATTSHALLLSAIAMSGSASDLLISTALTLTLNSILGATTAWKPNLDVARKLLEMRGGPASMLADTRAAMGRGEADDSALMRTRASLEYTVMMDMCDSLGAGTAPRVMLEPFCPWWFDFASMSQGPPGQAILDPSQAPSDWETVETILGVSRGLVELLNRTAVLVAQCLDPSAAVGFHPAAPTSFEDRLGRAQELLLELEIWKGEGDQADPNVVLSRVQYGNLIWSHAIKILVLTDVLRVPHSDPSVQESAYLGQQLLLQCNVANGQVVCLMWPAIIFGCLQMPHDTLGRNSTRTIVEAMRDRCAWDVDAVLTVIRHVWGRRDRGEADPTWREYQRESGLLFM